MDVPRTYPVSPGALWLTPPPALDDQLEMLYRVTQAENGECEFEIRPEGYCDHDHWSIVISYVDSEEDHDDGRETYAIQYTKFAAPTLTEAVDRAWRHHGAPVKCAACNGEGGHWFEGDQIPADVPEVRIQTSHDGRRRTHVDCGQCFESSGYVLTAAVAEAVS